MANNAESPVVQLPRDGTSLREGFAAKGICSGCGACVTVCQILGNKVLKYNQKTSALDLEISAEECRHCGICYAVCPRKNYLGAAGRKPVDTGNYLGNYRKFEILRPIDPDISGLAQGGGLVMAILKTLMEIDYLDGAIVSTAGENWTSIPHVAHNFQELSGSLGMRTAVSTNILFIDKMYGEHLKHQYAGFNDKKYAFVGPTCMVTAIQNMRNYKLDVARKIRLTIGLFCLENMNYGEITHQAEEKTKTTADEWENVNIKGKFIVRLKGKEAPLEIPLKEFNDIIRGSCHVCLDFVNFDADISLGSMGAPPEYSSVLIRTKAGQEALNLVMRHNTVAGIPEMGPAAKAIYDKALKNIETTARKKITRNLKQWEEITG
jgi:coenzyme F420-reducing hydrogenase beta subunit